MAQKLNESLDSQEISEKPEANRLGGLHERRPLRGLSLWNYPEEVKAITWSETIKKEARGLDGLDLGEVQAIDVLYVRTVKGVMKREAFFIPRELAQAFDGSTLWFCFESGLEHRFKRAMPPTETDFAEYSVRDPYLRSGLRRR